MGRSNLTCMINPKTCTHGGAISFWINLLDIDYAHHLDHHGVLQSYNSRTFEGIGFHISHFELQMRYLYLSYFTKIEMTIFIIRCVFFIL